MNTRPGITQPAVEPCAGASAKQQTKQKYKPNHQQTGLPPPSALPITKKKKKTSKQTKSSAKISPYSKLTQTTAPTLGGAETKRKKEFNCEAWEKDTSNTVS